MITENNWNYTLFTAPNKKAFISLGAGPVSDGKEIEISYLVTVTDEQGNDIFQSSYPELKLACEEINQRYAHWQVMDTRYANASDSGCGSCEAH